MGWQGLYYIVNGVTLHESYNRRSDGGSWKYVRVV